MSINGRQGLNFRPNAGKSDDYLIGQQFFNDNDNDEDERELQDPEYGGLDTEDIDYQYSCSDFSSSFTQESEQTQQQHTEYYYNYWTYPRELSDDRELLPSSIRLWINSYKDPEREFCKVVATYLFSFIIGLQVFSYVVSSFDLHLTVPYCGEIKGQLEFECHLWLFLFAWIAAFICMAITMVFKYLLYVCWWSQRVKEKTN